MATSLLIVLLEETVFSEGEPLLPEVEAETVKDLLRLLASGMLTVATVTLSVLVLALNLAAGHASPRAVPALMADAPTQNALSIFLSTFVFSVSCSALIGAGLIREDGSTVAFILALLSAAAAVAMLVLWIHHVAHTMKLNAIVHRVFGDARQSLENYLRRAERDPDEDSEKDPEAGAELDEADREGEPLRPPVSGFIQLVDVERLQELARENELAITMAVREGDFVHPALDMMTVAGGEAKDDDCRDMLRATIVLGAERTHEGDPLLGFELLAEVACRALSPSLNDPQTAIICIDYLGALLARAGEVKGEDFTRICRAGTRVELVAIGFHDMMERAFRPVIREGAGSAEVLAAVSRVLALLARTVEPEHLGSICESAERVRGFGEARLVLKRDREWLGEGLDSLIEEAGRRSGKRK